MQRKDLILVVDDEQLAAESLVNSLEPEGYQVEVANSAAQAIELIRSRPYAVVVSDYRLGQDEGTTLLPHAKAARSFPQVIFVTGFGSVDSAVSAIHEGAFDYLSKSEDEEKVREELVTIVRKALKHRSALLKEPALSEGAVEDNQPHARMLIGKSAAMVQIYRFIAKAALTRENVLVTGESGTGKELVASAIHAKGPWANKPFVTVNCCALTETLLESELFGHVKGSFTGATQNKRGLFEEANEGTLFLDEIGDIPLSLQVKLLRAIQEGEIKPVGANESHKVNVRVIAATHRNLKDYVAQGKFREDLYYRLKVIYIHIPSLSLRQQDLPDLVHYFVEKAARKTGKRISKVSDEAMEFLLRYPWPGNIRELENAIGHAISMTSTSILFPEDFPPEVFLFGENGEVLSVTGNDHSTEPVAVPHSNVDELHQSLEDMEKTHILRVLESVYYNKSKAAQILGIDRVTLYRKAFRYGIFGKKETTTEHVMG